MIYELNWKANALMTEIPLLYGLDVITKQIWHETSHETFGLLDVLINIWELVASTAVNTATKSKKNMLLQWKYCSNDDTHRRRYGGNCGTAPRKYEVGDGTCIRIPNILRSSVVGIVKKYELTKKGVKEEIFLSEIE